MKNTALILFIFLNFIQLSVFAAPVNDNCANATTLTVNSGSTCSAMSFASFTAATVSPEGNTCTATTTGDIWYQFVATTTSHTIALSNFTGTPQPVAMVLYEGSDCATLTQIYCSINNVILATALVPGTTYKLRLYFNSTNPSLSATTFSVCVSTPPPPSGSNQTDCVITTINYDFESPAPTATVYPIFLNHNVVQGWRTTASDQMMEFWPVPNYENVPSYSGNQFIELNANLVSGVYQDYQTPEVTTFSYGFAHRGRQGTDTCQLLAGPPGGPYTPVGSPISTGNTSWSYNTGTYDVPSGQTVTRFIFQSVSSVGGASVGNYLDAITFTANNGILSPNPYNMGCGDNTANINAAGTGMWVAHGDNPSTATIANPSQGNTTITDFGAAGTYHFDWVTQYCTSTLEISFSGDETPPPTVANVTYCQGESATPLTAEALPGYFINWFSGSAPTPSTATIGSQDYYVSQVAPNGCESIPAIITVTVNPMGDAVTGFTLPASACEGSALIQPDTDAGFTGGGVFSAEPGLMINASTGEIDPATSTPGDYNVTYEVVANTCTGAGSTTVPFTVNPVPTTPDLTIVQPDCATSTGSITVNSPTGSEFTYSLNGVDYQSSPVFATVDPGIYTLYIVTTAGCSTTYQNITINTAPVTPPAPVTTVTQPTCATATGTITISSPVGAAYTYSLNGADYQSSPVFTDVSEGAYTITVQNTDGCFATSNTTVNPQPPTPAVPDVSATQPDCFIQSGTLTVNTPTGSGLTYSLDGAIFQTGTVFSGLAAGDYTITVKNIQGCTNTSAQFTINTAPAQVPAISRTVTQPDCDVFTGVVEVSAPVGSQYTYSLDGVNYQAETTFTNVAPGSYTLTVLNTDGCSATSPITINDAPTIPAVPNVSVTQPDCSVPSGKLTVNSPIGPGLTYSIDGVNYQVSNVFSGLPQGSYSITVKNTFGCMAVSSVYSIDVAPAPAPAPMLSASQPDCNTGVGAIAVSSPLGGGYTYSIDGGAWQANNVFTGLTPAVYTILVKSPDGCIAGSSISINAVPDTPAAADVTITQPGCVAPTGSIQINSPLGVSYTYSIDGINFQLGTTFSGLSEGNYTVTVKNTAGCISTTNVTLNAPIPIPQIPVLSGIQPSCTDPTGTITVTSPTGSGLTYSIDGINYQAGTTFTGLTPGITYNVTVQNANGCTRTSGPLTIHPAPEVPDVPVLDVVQPSCGHLRGIVTVTSPVGTGYKYSINGISFQPTNMFTNVLPGTYTVTVKNADGCTASETVTIVPAPPVSDPGVITGPGNVCENGTAQYANTIPDGVWSVSNENFATIDTNGELTGISDGNVIVYYTVQNPDECEATASFSVWVTGAPQPQLQDDFICKNLETNEYATVDLNTGLSVADYTFAWYKGSELLSDTDSYITIMEPGSYSVEVTSRATGCTGTATATIGVSSEPQINVIVGEDFTLSQTITINITGGSGDYEYQLNSSGYQDEPVFTNVSEGEYIVFVRDKNGCGMVVETVYVLDYPRFFSPNGDGDHDTWYVEGLKNRPDARIIIFDRYGKVVGYVGGAVGWDGTLEGHNLPATDYWFKLFYISSDGQHKEFQSHFSLLR